MQLLIRITFYFFRDRRFPSTFFFVLYFTFVFWSRPSSKLQHRQNRETYRQVIPQSLFWNRAGKVLLKTLMFGLFKSVGCKFETVVLIMKPFFLYKCKYIWDAFKEWHCQKGKSFPTCFFCFLQKVKNRFSHSNLFGRA